MTSFIVNDALRRINKGQVVSIHRQDFSCTALRRTLSCLTNLGALERRVFSSHLEYRLNTGITKIRIAAKGKYEIFKA